MLSAWPYNLRFINFASFACGLHVQDNCRLEKLKQLLKFDGTEDEHGMLPKIEEEWCSTHYLVQSAINQVSDSCMIIVLQEKIPFSYVKDSASWKTIYPMKNEKSFCR